MQQNKYGGAPVKKFFKVLLKILKWIGIILAILIAVLFLVRLIGRKVNNRTPEGGINDTMYVNINGSMQWISVYGQNRDNPVLLYIHGGPFGPTSWGDWCTLRRLSADYTVVNWDQRGVGHNYPAYKETQPITAQDMVEDGKAMTDFLCDYLQKDRITLLGHSMGSSVAANLALEYPERYDAVIAASLVVDELESRRRYKEYVLDLTADDPEYHAAAEQIDPEQGIAEQIEPYMKLALSQYGNTESLLGEAEFSVPAAVWLNPYCTLAEQYRMLFCDMSEYENMLSDGHPNGDVYCEQLSVGQRTEYEVPFYLVEGRSDHNVSTMVEVAAEYFERVSAPDKDMLYIDGGHVSPLLCCDQLAAFLHQIAEKQKAA